MLHYPIRLKVDGDTLLATSPDFPELTTFGDDKEDALMHAVDALEEVIAGRIADREDIPAPSRGRYKVALPTQTALKVLLYQAMGEQGVGKAKLARLLNCHLPQIDRLLDLNHASRLSQLDGAFNALGLKVNVQLDKPASRRKAKRPRRVTAKRRRRVQRSVAGQKRKFAA